MRTGMKYGRKLINNTNVRERFSDFGASSRSADGKEAEGTDGKTEAVGGRPRRIVFGERQLGIRERKKMRTWRADIRRFDCDSRLSINSVITSGEGGVSGCP